LSTLVEGAAEGPQPPVSVHLNARQLLSAPDWDASADLNGIPAAPLLEIARRMGVPVPDKLTVNGSASGSLAYARDSGFSGHIGLEQASINLPDAAPLTADSVSLDIGGDTGAGIVRLKPATLRVGENRSVELEGSAALGVGLSGARALDLKITTRGLAIADMRSFGLGAIPLIEHATQGSWRGWARFRAGDSGGPSAAHRGEAIATDPLDTRDGQWTGESELLDARIPVEGLANPVRIQSASISLNGKRASVTRLRAKVGDVSFTGDYRWDAGAARPHRFRIAIAEADAGELQRLFDPALVRQRGFIARTLGLRAGALPEWLAARHAEGTIAIETLTAGDTKIRGLWSRLLWDAGVVHLLGLNARVESPAPQSTLAGDLTVDLSTAAPQFHFEGEAKDLVWRGGRIDLEGIMDAEGSGLQLLETARAEGRLRGRGIAFAPEADFRTISGDFQAGPGAARWKLSNLEVAVGPDTFVGSGVSQSDGRMVLDLTNRGRQVHYAGTLLAAGAIP